MTPRKWSINALAVELGVDRRTLAGRLARVEPAGSGTHGPLYWLADAVRALHPKRPRGGEYAEGVVGLAGSLADTWGSSPEVLGELAKANDPAECDCLITATELSAIFGALQEDQRFVEEPRFDALPLETLNRMYVGLAYDGWSLADVAEFARNAAPPPKRRGAR